MAIIIIHYDKLGIFAHQLEGYFLLGLKMWGNDLKYAITLNEGTANENQLQISTENI